MVSDFKSDFPFEILSKGDYKVAEEIGTTFGNDKILTGKNFRPSFVVSATPDTVILQFCVKIVEDTIKILSNTGENKEKTDFFKNFDWFDNFTQSNKTKFNNVIKKEIFYPGAKIIAEGSNNHVAYVIVDGTVKIQCKKSAGSKFTDLLY